MISFWVIYWAVGALSISNVIDENLAIIVRHHAKEVWADLSEQTILWATFAAVCLAAFAWPVVFIPRNRL